MECTDRLNLASAATRAEIQRLAGLGTWSLDFRTNQMTLSAEAARLSGLVPSAKSEAICDRAHFVALIAESDRVRVDASWRAALDGHIYDIEYGLAPKHGNPSWIWERAKIEFSQAGHPIRAIGFVQDITHRKHAQAEMVVRANHDTLTSLPNRNLLAEHLNVAIPLARRNKQQLAVMYIDLDRFKQVNDVLGHDMGDELLRQAAQRMATCLRESDLVARQGGDEFIVVLQDVAHESNAGLVALKLIERLTQPFNLQGETAHVGASVGLTLFPEDGADSDTLFRNADMAMFHAKAAGRGTLSFFDPHMRQAALSRQAMETDMRRAIVQQEFVLHYQPIFNLTSQRVDAIEALIRWDHPTRGLIGPDEFLTSAEESGLIRELGRWGLLEVFRQMAVWQSNGMDLNVSVNVSCRQIADGLALPWLQENLDLFGISASKITFEITEGVLIKDTPATHRWIRDIKAMGFKLSLDDFGKGYSSLGFLQHFHLNEIKIDKSFVQEVKRNPRQRALVKAIVDIGLNMGLVVIAEGVEDAETMAVLSEIGCTHAQGFHLAHPMPPEQLIGLLRQIDYPTADVVARRTAHPTMAIHHH